MGIVHFTTSTGYEIVYCSLETPRLVFLDCIPRSDVGSLPRIGSLNISLVSTYPKEEPVAGFNRPGVILTSVTLPFLLSLFFGALPLPFRRGSS